MGLSILNFSSMISVLPKLVGFNFKRLCSQEIPYKQNNFLYIEESSKESGLGIASILKDLICERTANK